jgi:hypothetical protein
MLAGGSKYQKPIKTKFKKSQDHETIKTQKKRHHDKTLYRLAREEKEDYVILDKS